MDKIVKNVSVVWMCRLINSLAFIIVVGTVLWVGLSLLTSGGNQFVGIRCIDDYRFIVEADGSVRQVMDEKGNGIRCENPNLGKPGAFGRM